MNPQTTTIGKQKGQPPQVSINKLYFNQTVTRSERKGKRERVKDPVVWEYEIDYAHNFLHS